MNLYRLYYPNMDSTKTPHSKTYQGNRGKLNQLIAPSLKSAFIKARFARTIMQVPLKMVQPFVPEEIFDPSIKYRWKKKKINTIGNNTITDIAIK